MERELEQLKKEVDDLKQQLQEVNKEVWGERKKFNYLIAIIEELDGEFLSILGEKLQAELDKQEKES